jgi:CBS domain-containing protein
MHSTIHEASDSGPRPLSSADFGLAEEPLRSLPKRPALSAPPSTSVREALLRMDQTGADHLVVVDEPSHLPLGILTLSNLVQAIAVEGGELEQPVVGVMTAAPFTLPADAPTHRATVLMTKRNVRHVVLLEPDGRLCNVISRADLFGLRGGGAEALAEAVTLAMDMAAMTSAAAAIRRRGTELFDAGMGMASVGRWISALNDIIAIRVIELIEDEFDLPAIPWCWLVFGSEGRLEQTLSTDQDNGIIFLPGEEKATEDLREAFIPFAKKVNLALDACGFPLCRGDIMAGNRAWCLSLAEWKMKFSTWMEAPEPEALLNSTVFFDFRPLYGSYHLADDLRQWLIPRPPAHPRFLRALAVEALTCPPPLGWANRFVYDGGKAHPHTMDLKLHGSRPFVDAARIWSLAEGVWATNTGDRLSAVSRARNWRPQETAAELEAFYLVQRFRMQQQIMSEDPAAANRLNPSSLNTLNRLMLKEALKQAKKVQLRLKLEFEL